nr:MAG TPA: hypothetical protein [Caudoviricetes sp.]
MENTFGNAKLEDMSTHMKKMLLAASLKLMIV